MKCNLCGHPLEYHIEFEQGNLKGWKCKGCDCFLVKGRGIKSKDFYGRGDES